jgi:hypothetical protein
MVKYSLPTRIRFDKEVIELAKDKMSVVVERIKKLGKTGDNF